MSKFGGAKLVIAAGILALWPALVGISLPGEFGRLIEAGNSLYSAGKFKKAGEKYDKAAELDPDSPEPAFNKGAAEYRQGNFQDALAGTVAAARAADGPLKRDAEYNAGNCAYRMQKLDQAIEHYKRALTLDPEDQDAKHNLELALQAQQQQKEQDKQDQDQKKDDEQDQKQDDQSGDQQKQQDQDQKKDEEKQDEEKKDKSEESQGDQKQDEKQQQEQEQKQQQQEQQGGEQSNNQEAKSLTPEQAAQLLSSLAEEDANMQKIIRRAPLTRERPTDKDW